MTYTDVMIDIETASASYNACILSIGLVKFNLFELMSDNINLESKEELEILIHLDSCIEAGMEVSEDTMEWWKRQNQEVYNHVFNGEPRYSLTEGLKIMNEFLKDVNGKERRYWSQGSFDYINLENALKKVNMESMWKFYEVRDSRTVINMIKDMQPWEIREMPKKPKDAHSSVVDCNHQIECIVYVYKKMKILINWKAAPVIGEYKEAETKKIKLNNEAISTSQYYSLRSLRQGHQNVDDWKCEKCDANNFSYRKYCYKCTKPRIN